MSDTRELRWLTVRITPENREELQALTEFDIGNDTCMSYGLYNNTFLPTNNLIISSEELIHDFSKLPDLKLLISLGMTNREAFIKIYGMDFINSSGNSKILNLTGNVASLAMFIYFKKVNYPYAIAIGIVMFLGAQIGAKIAIAKGAKFIKPFFLVVTAITAAKMIMAKFM